MNEPLQLSDQAWKDTETLVHRLESAAGSLDSTAKFYDELVSGLRFACGAATTSLIANRQGIATPLARSGIGIYADSQQLAEPAPDSASNSVHQKTHNQKTQITASSAVHPEVELRLELQFDQPIALATEENLIDLLEVLLSFAARVYLRDQFTQLTGQLEAQDDRDRLLGDLNEGTTLEQSFAAIAKAIASRSTADRVSLLRVQGRNSKLIATSTQPNVDHRSVVAQSLRDLSKVGRDQDALSWPLGEEANKTDAELLEALESHAHVTGCRGFHLITVRDQESIAIATVIREWLRPTTESPTTESANTESATIETAGEEVSSPEPPTEAASWHSIQQPVEGAIRRAVIRDRLASRSLAGSLAMSGRKTWVLLGFAFTLLMLLAFYPATLRVPADGKVVATERTRMFAPADGVVTEVFVVNHQTVNADQPLLRLTSASLEQSRAEIEGRLATLRAQSAANLASRSSNRRADGDGRSAASSVAADEQVLKTEIAGLEKQLALIEQQEADLSLVSPIAGEVDGWDLKQSLSGRPVIRGQHLLDVIAPDGGHHVELQLADHLSGYINTLSTDESVGVSFRLRSDPTVTYRGIVRKVSATAQQNINGESFIRLTVDVDEGPAESLRHGATVIAQIDGPEHSLGYVWLRQFIHWSRENIWL